MEDGSKILEDYTKWISGRRHAAGRLVRPRLSGVGYGEKVPAAVIPAWPPPRAPVREASTIMLPVRRMRPAQAVQYYPRSGANFDLAIVPDNQPVCSG